MALGALGVINSWDLPTYGAILGLCAGLAALRLLRYPAGGAGRRARWPCGAGPALGLVMVGVLAGLAYLPFYAHFQVFYTQILPVLDGVDGMRRTKLAEWLVLWGLFAFVAASYVVVGLRRYPWRRRGSRCWRVRRCPGAGQGRGAAAAPGRWSRPRGPAPAGMSGAGLSPRPRSR